MDEIVTLRFSLGIICLTEAGIAYKDISEVVETMDVLGISKKVVRLKPIGNIKG